MASLLESFVFMFESDTSKLEQGIDEAEKGSGKLKKTIDNTDKSAKDLGKSFLDTVSSAKGVLISLAGLGGLSAVLIGNANSVDQLGKFSQRLGLNIEDIDAWGRAVEKSGGSMEGFQSTVGSLSSSLAEFARTGSGSLAEMFAQLGIAAFDEQGNVKQVLDILPEIADRMRGLSASQSAELAEKLGLDQGTILLLQQGRAEVDKIIRKQKELGTINEKDAKIAAEFTKQMNNIQKVFGNVVTYIGTAILPAFSAFLDSLLGIVEFARSHKTLVEGFFIGIGVVLLAILSPFALIIAKAALVVAAIVAIGAAFALIYEDIIAFNNGQDSMIGELVKQYPILGDVIKAFGDSWDYVKEKALEIWDILKSIPDDVEGGFKRLTIAIVNIFKDIGTVVADLWSEIFSSENIDAGLKTLEEKFFAIADVLKKVFSGIFSGLAEAIPSFGSFFGFGENEDIVKGKKVLNAAASSPLASQTSNSLSSQVSSRNTSVSVGSVQVDARGGDSKEIAAGSKSALLKEMRNAITEYDDGVAI